MLKVHILATCSHCGGEAYLPISEAEDSQGHKYVRHIPCTFCEGSGNEPKWIDIQDLANIIKGWHYLTLSKFCRNRYLN
jgi:hypothetical protein